MPITDMRPKALLLTCGHGEGAGRGLRRHASPEREIVVLDQYELDAAPLDDHAALLVGMHVDQRFLASRAERLAGYLRQGGTMVVSGHVAYPFVPGITTFRPTPTGHLRDLQVHREIDHPIWEGVSEKDLTFRRGVAGFYGRVTHVPPEGARVIHTLGPDRWPLDMMWRVGQGRVLLHGGNDLWQFGGGPTDSAGRIAPQLLEWLLDGEGRL